MAITPEPDHQHEQGRRRGHSGLAPRGSPLRAPVFAVLQCNQAAFEEGVNHAKALLNAKDPQEYQLNAAAAQPTMEKPIAYSRSVYEAPRRTANWPRFPPSAGRRVQQNLAGLLDKVSKNAPAESDVAVRREVCARRSQHRLRALTRLQSRPPKSPRRFRRSDDGHQRTAERATAFAVPQVSRGPQPPPPLHCGAKALAQAKAFFVQSLSLLAAECGDSASSLDSRFHFPARPTPSS
jgi:hypothetical protein